MRKILKMLRESKIRFNNNNGHIRNCRTGTCPLVSLANRKLKRNKFGDSDVFFKYLPKFLGIKPSTAEAIANAADNEDDKNRKRLERACRIV